MSLRPFAVCLVIITKSHVVDPPIYADDHDNALLSHNSFYRGCSSNQDAAQENRLVPRKGWGWVAMTSTLAPGGNSLSSILIAAILPCL